MKHPTLVTAAVAAALAATMATGITYAATKAGTAKACVSRHHALKLLTAKGSCPHGASPITIGQRGRRGARGRIGPPGPGAGKLTFATSSTTASNVTLAQVDGWTYVATCTVNSPTNVSTELLVTPPPGVTFTETGVLTTVTTSPANTTTTPAQVFGRGPGTTLLLNSSSSSEQQFLNVAPLTLTGSNGNVEDLSVTIISNDHSPLSAPVARCSIAGSVTPTS